MSVADWILLYKAWIGTLAIILIILGFVLLYVAKRKDSANIGAFVPFPIIIGIFLLSVIKASSQLSI